jgi:hypothetical protein
MGQHAEPEITTARGLKDADGKVVTLVGVYRKRIAELKKRRPGKIGKVAFLGFVDIELEGMATDYDTTAWDGAKAIVKLGVDARPDDEVDQLADKRVRVTGKLVLSPAPEDPDVAQEDPEPTLFEPQAPELVD